MNGPDSPVALDRRMFVAATAFGSVATGEATAQVQRSTRTRLAFGRPQPFSFDALKTRARDLAGQPYVAPPRPSPEIIGKIDYAAHGAIRFKSELALFSEGPGKFPTTFFHLGQFFQKPVRMHVVEGQPGREQAREIVYSPDYFEMPVDSIARGLPENAGFAGFRFQESREGHPGPKGTPLDWRRNDWVAFLGASYFRAIGDLFQYGLSARAIAVDPAVAGVAEEFPDFTHVYIETPAPGSDSVTVHALLDGPGLAGAMRFVMTRKAGVTMDIDASLHLRRDIARFCLAPLTSMYWYSETAKPGAIDWRPEVHDSDGLALWTGSGERIWRPLNNPSRTMVSSFVDANPRGFGLLQRDRAFDHYQDGVHYERRPSLWVEPLGDWGAGAVQLVEIPTDDEIHDNIVVAWVPGPAARAGQSHDLRYRLHWQADEPTPTPLARCIATRLGNGGQPGMPRPKGVRKFMVEFRGGPLATLPDGVRPQAMLSASRGAFSYVFTEAVPNDVPGHWRAQFDLTAEGNEPVEMRLYLRNGDAVLSETWLYQYHPV